jgi:sugar lactone lactonase YvrE
MREYAAVRLILGDGEPGFGRQGAGGAFRIHGPAGLAYDPWRARLLVAVIHNHCLLSFDLDTQEARVVLGQGRPGPAARRCPATECTLNGPEAVCVDPAGRIYVADSRNQVIRRYDPGDGSVAVVAGTGLPGGGGEGGPATEAALHEPCGVRWAPDGGFYLVDFRNHRVCRVRPDGILVRVAGTGEPGFDGDGGPADRARIAGPHGMALDGRGNVYVVDNHNHRIRRVDAGTGLMSTVAGTDEWGFGGDGGPATEARLSGPKDLLGPHAVCCDEEGTLFIADTGSNRIRAVDPNSGIIRTVAGCGVAAPPRPDEAPLAATIRGPHGLVADNRGNLYFNEYENHCVRALTVKG